MYKGNGETWLRQWNVLYVGIQYRTHEGFPSSNFRHYHYAKSRHFKAMENGPVGWEVS